jgi:hypothetical protein
MRSRATHFTTGYCFWFMWGSIGRHTLLGIVVGLFGALLGIVVGL